MEKVKGVQLQDRWDTISGKEDFIPLMQDSLKIEQKLFGVRFSEIGSITLKKTSILIYKGDPYFAMLMTTSAHLMLKNIVLDLSPIGRGGVVRVPNWISIVDHVSHLFLEISAWN